MLLFSMNFSTILKALVAPYPDLSDMEYERYFNFACIWAFGGTLAAEHRESFSNWWYEEFDQQIDYPVEGTVSIFSLFTSVGNMVRKSIKFVELLARS